MLQQIHNKDLVEKFVNNLLRNVKVSQGVIELEAYKSNLRNKRKALQRHTNLLVVQRKDLLNPKVPSAIPQKKDLGAFSDTSESDPSSSIEDETSSTPEQLLESIQYHEHQLKTITAEIAQLQVESQKQDESLKKCLKEICQFTLSAVNRIARGDLIDRQPLHVELIELYNEYRQKTGAFRSPIPLQ